MSIFEMSSATTDWPILASRVDSAVQTAHHRVRLDHDDRCLPPLTQLVGQQRRVRFVAFAENAEESTVFTLEHPLDAGVVGGRQTGGIEPVAGGEPVVHALAHRFVLCGHQPRRLGAGQAEGILQLGGRQAAQFAGGHCRRVGAEHRAGVPAAVEHLRPVQCVADARPDFETDDRREQEVGAAGRV
jgi:hypothetical protein